MRKLFNQLIFTLYSFEFDVMEGDLALCTLVLDVKDASKTSWFRQTPVLGQVCVHVQVILLSRIAYLIYF